MKNKAKLAGNQAFAGKAVYMLNGKHLNQQCASPDILVSCAIQNGYNQVALPRAGCKREGSQNVH